MLNTPHLSPASKFVFSPRTPNVARNFGYTHTAEHALFTWQHVPQTGTGRKIAVILCSPMGYEYTHSHRTYQHWADQLAAAGCFVVRFDYASTGDSSGCELPDNLLPVWLNNIISLAQQVQTAYPEYELCLAGLRMGATLAHLAAAQLKPKHLIVWEPIVQGRRYLRELQALANFGADPADLNTGYTEFAGFLMSDATAEALKTIALLDNPLDAHTQVLCMCKTEGCKSDDYIHWLTQQGNTLEVQHHLGYEDMLVVPQDTLVPFATLSASAKWLTREITTAHSPELINTAPHAAHLTQSSEITLANGIQEQGLWYDKYENKAQQKHLFGILSQPAHFNAERPLVILLNSGSVHHVGPNRIYTLMARTIAEAGLACIRLDLTGLGDSFKPNLERENHPYQPTTQNNLATAINYCKTEGLAQKFIIAGICSGAHGAFHSALNSSAENISEIIVINPLAFYWEDGMSLETPDNIQTAQDSKYYASSMRDPKKWLKLLSGKASVGYILNFVKKQSIEIINTWIKYINEVVLNNHTELSRDLLRIIRAKIAISLLVASNDPGVDLVNAQAKRTLKTARAKGSIQVKIFSGANHTFSRYKHRQEFLAFIKEKFTRGGEKNL
ncbi:MAG: hypothetical protein RL497_3166 [Pseudomonadota bacterium]|jgi:alpha-beta hydrolase superfamily lysophospholipase